MSLRIMRYAPRMLLRRSLYTLSVHSPAMMQTRPRALSSKVTTVRPMFIRSFSNGATDPEVFQRRVAKTFKRIAEGVEDQKDQNEHFIVEVKEDGLTIDLGASGSFYWQLEPDAGKLVMFSPCSGVRKYVWCERNNWWAGEDDGHIMLELFVRDMLNVARGVPNL